MRDINNPTEKTYAVSRSASQRKGGLPNCKTVIENMNFQKANVLRMASDAGIVENKTTLLYAVQSSAMNILRGL